MAVHVETLDKLERRITLTLPATTIASEVESRLRKLSRTVKADGFRPGKVPMSVVAQRYGYSVHYEVMNDKVGQAFSDAVNEAKLRVAGPPRITREGRARPRARSRSTRPSRSIPRSSSAIWRRPRSSASRPRSPKPRSTRRSTSCGSSAARSQQRPQAKARAESDRVTIDFEGKIDGVPFDGGKAEGFQFVIGEGQMLRAVRQGRARHEGRRIEDLPAPVPGRLPGQGRGRQGSRLHWSR